MNGSSLPSMILSHPVPEHLSCRLKTITTSCHVNHPKLGVSELTLSEPTFTTTHLTMTGHQEPEVTRSVRDGPSAFV